MFEIGDRVGSYEIVARLKSGGMATLFLGRRGGAAGFAKYVAIKVVHEHLASNASFVQMFVDEARLGARIQHPNVVHVEEFQETGGRLFLVMEYVYGCSLGQFFYQLARRKRRLAPTLAVHIAIKVADGLHAAHELRDSKGESLGVVHRDVSPQNVLLAFQGNVKLIDFGVAKARGRGETRSRSIKGKFRYMSPEQARGDEIDRRSDVYALGVVLWEMLTMRRRFNGKTDAEVLEQVRHPEPVPASRFHENLPEALDAVVLKATAVDPADRYPTAHEMREAMIDAIPRAAALHESVLGELLTLVMADQIEQRRSELPSGVSGLTVDVPAEDAVVADRVLRTLTIATEDIELLADGKSDPTGPPEPPTLVFDGGPTTVQPELAAALSSAPPPPSATPSVPSTAAPREGVPLPVVLGAVAAILLGLGGLTVAAVYLLQREPPVTATPLPPASSDAGAPLAEVVLAEVVPDAGAPAVAEVTQVPDAGPAAPSTGDERGDARGADPDPREDDDHGGRRRGPRRGGRSTAGPVTPVW